MPCCLGTLPIGLHRVPAAWAHQYEGVKMVEGGRGCRNISSGPPSPLGMALVGRSFSVVKCEVTRIQEILLTHRLLNLFPAGKQVTVQKKFPLMPAIQAH